MRKTVNKSELIREMLSKNPSLKVSEIVAQMKKDGNPVSPPLVYQTLRKMSKSKGTGKKRGRKPGSVVAKPTAAPSTDNLFVAMQSFVTAAGGLDKAIEILNVFKR